MRTERPAPAPTANTARSGPGRLLSDRSPINQNSMPRSWVSSPRLSSMLTTALAPAATTTPVSSSRAAVQPPSPRASANTSRVVARAPNVALTSISRPLIPSSIAASAATAAPPETPMTNGSASGLRSRTCISTPASASTPPAANAVSVRGRRRSKTSVCDERVGRAQAVPQFRHAHVDAAAHQRHDERRERGQHERAMQTAVTRRTVCTDAYPDSWAAKVTIRGQSACEQSGP